MDLTKYRIDPAKFALACVQSSPDLTTEDKLKVYKEAYEEALTFYHQIQTAVINKGRSKEDRSLKEMGDFFDLKELNQSPKSLPIKISRTTLMKNVFKINLL